MTIEVRTLTGADIVPVIDSLARLRISVFRDWPYLYDGDMDYERGYLAPMVESPTSAIVGAFDGDVLVGAATCSALSEHKEDFAAAFDGSGIAMEEVFYLAESVLLPAHRGRGLGHSFFDHREARARSLGMSKAAFCAVDRPGDHPARPEDYSPLDPFWRKRGYAPLPGVVARFAWRDVGDAEESSKPLRFWMRTL